MQNAHEQRREEEAATVREQPGESLIGTLVRALSRRELLLVLDSSVCGEKHIKATLGAPQEILDVRGASEKQRLFGYKEQVWTGFHYGHSYLESMKSQTFWDAEFDKIEAVDRALVRARE